LIISLDLKGEDLTALSRASWILYNQLTQIDLLWSRLMKNFAPPNDYLLQSGSFIPYPEDLSQYKLYLCTFDYYQHAYIRALKKYPMPTEANINDFISHVSHAHSWYKHLPISGPGKPFLFYVHPTCHMKYDYVKKKWTEYVKEDCWHYSDLPTDKYRKRFGLLSYTNNTTKPLSSLFVQDLNLHMLPIPNHILQLGTVNLTAFLYGPEDFQGLRKEFSAFLKAAPPKGNYETDVNPQLVEYFYVIQEYNKQITQINNQYDLREDNASNQKELLWKQLLAELFPKGKIPKRHTKDVDRVLQKASAHKGIVKDVFLVSLAEHCRELAVIKQKLMEIVNFINNANNK